jgi:hypothetical protein
MWWRKGSRARPPTKFQGNPLPLNALGRKATGTHKQMNVEKPRLVVQVQNCGRAIRAILATVYPSEHPLPDEWTRLVRRIEGRQQSV